MTALFTRADYDLLPEGFPAQLIEGSLVREPAPSFGHQRLAGEVYVRLRALVGGARVAQAPVDVRVDDLNVFQPDVVALRGPLPDDARDVGVPLLVVEIMSPSSLHRDREVKRTRLLEAGVEEVWLLDPSRRTIEVYDLGRYRDAPRRVAGAGALASAALPGFALAPRDLWPD